MFFFRDFTCLAIWAIAGQELGTLNKRVHNSLTFHDNSWALRFDNFSEFQNIISDGLFPPTPQGHYDVLRTKISMWLAPKALLFKTTQRPGMNLQTWQAFFIKFAQYLISKRNLETIPKKICKYITTTHHQLQLWIKPGP